jgi:hypothetical protein
VAVEWKAEAWKECRRVSVLSPGKGRDFHVAKYGLASGAGSDDRVKGATLAGLLR